MDVIRYHPGAPLDRYVECFWWSRRDTVQPYFEHMLPSGGAQLIFALHDSPFTCFPGESSTVPIRWSRGVVHGPRWKYFVAGPKPCGAIVGVSFRPGAAGAVLGVPTGHFADRHVPIDELWGRRGHVLRERLQAAEIPSALFRLLELEMAKHLHPPLLIHPAVAQALAIGQAGYQPRIADLQRDAGLSPRHFIALFRSAVGVTPKHYFRMRRFGRVLQCLARGAGNLADIAASYGYADQSHLTREFRELAGITPTQYQPRGRDGVFHHRCASSEQPHHSTATGHG